VRRFPPIFEEHPLSSRRAASRRSESPGEIFEGKRQRFPARWSRWPRRHGGPTLRHACDVPAHAEIDRASGALLGAPSWATRWGYRLWARQPLRSRKRLTMLDGRLGCGTYTDDHRDGNRVAE
jgi:hypothetical protein